MKSRTLQTLWCGLGGGFGVVRGGVRGGGGRAVGVGSLDASHVQLEGLI